MTTMIMTSFHAIVAQLGVLCGLRNGCQLMSIDHRSIIAVVMYLKYQTLPWAGELMVALTSPDWTPVNIVHPKLIMLIPYDKPR